MSIKAIDSQIMIARSADFAQDASAAQRRPEVAQMHQAKQERLNDALDQTRVLKSDDAQKSEFHPDDGGGGSAGYGGGEGGGEGKNAKGSKQELLVPTVEHIIDIKV